MTAKRCRKRSRLGSDICKERSVASTQLLGGDAEHLALSLLVEATQPDGDFDHRQLTTLSDCTGGVVRAPEYPDTRILYNDIDCLSQSTVVLCI